MDNITHSLIGVAVAQFVESQLTEKKSKENEEKDINISAKKSRRLLFLIVSILSNNFPDLDILYQRITPGVLGGLLHHRGHTHTLVGALPQLFLIMFLVWFFSKLFRLNKLSLQEWKLTWGISSAGLLLHIFADSWNSYGVHPFYPLWNGWLYGDAIFIVEPVIWAILAAGILREGISRLKFLPTFFLLGLSIYGLFGGYLGTSEMSFIGLCYLLTFFSHKIFFGRFKGITLCILMFYVVANFGISQQVKKIIFSSASDSKNILDVVVNSVPAAPWCRSLIEVSIFKSQYVVRRGILSTVPNLISVDDCRVGRREGDLDRIEDLNGFQIAWREDYQVFLENFSVLKDNCGLRSWLRFARVPFFTRDTYLDLRFSDGRIGNFSSLSKGEYKECLPFIPPWIPPRWDLIEKIGGTSWYNPN